jgi:hypothetical protein
MFIYDLFFCKFVDRYIFYYHHNPIALVLLSRYISSHLSSPSHSLLLPLHSRVATYSFIHPCDLDANAATYPVANASQLIQAITEATDGAQIILAPSTTFINIYSFAFHLLVSPPCYILSIKQ